MQTAHFSVDRYNGVSIVHLSGDLRVDGVPELSRALFDSLNGEQLVVVDLAELNYIDSAGIATLVALYKRLRQNGGGRVVLCGAPETIWGVFKTMKLDRLFRLYSDVREALQAAGLVDRVPQQG